MKAYTVDEPIYALATAFAPSALAVIRLSGKNSIELLSKGFSRSKTLLASPGKNLVHGNILEEDGSIIDEVVLAVYRQGSGYTSEEAVEITSHGSPIVLRRLFSRLEGLGFRQAEKGEFTFRAFMHGRMDLTQAEAVEEIIHSKSVVSQERALSRLNGSLKNSLGEIREILLEILASLEVQLDYAEDEILEDWVFPAKQVDYVLSRLKTLSATYSSSKVYREGAKVVLAGSTNAGKSSLFNLLVKEERAIVSSLPGTTRDFIETWLDLDGIPIRLFDTAGLRESGDEIEAEGIRRSEELIKEADLIICLVDPEDENRSVELPADKTIVVYSKSDRKRVEGLSISSLTGEGVAELLEEVKKRLASGSVTGGSEVAIDSQRQEACLEDCITCLEQAKANQGCSVDIMALFFQGALENLGYITGEVTTEELLDTLFSKFCLGK